jgi:hypothetical protein
VTQSVPYSEAANPPAHGGSLAYKQNFSSLVPNPSEGEPVQIFYLFSLALGVVRTVYCDAGVPEKWLVSLVPAAGVQLNVWNGMGASGDPIVIGGGGYVSLMATSEYITIQSRLGACLGNVTALRNMQVTIEPGNLA